MSITASEARRRLFPLIEEVNDDSEAVEIISNKGRAWLVPDEEYRSWKETQFLLRNPKNRERLLKGVEDVHAGRIQLHDLLDPDVDQ